MNTATPPHIRAGVADKNPLMQGALRHLPSADRRFELVHVASDCEGFMRSSGREPVEVGVIGWLFGACDGRFILDHLNTAEKPLRIILYTGDENRRVPAQVMANGSAAFVFKSEQPAVLRAYIMQLKAGCGYLETAAHFAAESLTGTNVEVPTTDDFTRAIDALVYEIDEQKQLVTIAHPTDLFDRNIIDAPAMLASFLTRTIGNNQGMATSNLRRCMTSGRHRNICGSTTGPRRSRPRGYTASGLAKMARLQGASRIHAGTTSYGKMEGKKDDTNIAYMIERDSADGPYYHQEWQGMRPTTPIDSGRMNALRQAEQCAREGADPPAFARDHREFARAFESFPGDADRQLPGWRNALDDAA